MNKKKTKTTNVRAYLTQREIGAMKFLKDNVEGLRNATPSQILKSCVLALALNIKAELEAIKEAEENETDKG